jgi:uncharacterized protein (DUF302 family)
MDRELSVSVESKFAFASCLSSVRQLITRSGFKILAEIPFHREFEQRLGLKFRQYTVLIVWDPLESYEAVLSDSQAGILLPFHVLVEEENKGTAIAATNLPLLAWTIGSIGLRMAANNLDRRVHELFSELKRLENEPAEGVYAPERGGMK